MTAQQATVTAVKPKTPPAPELPEERKAAVAASVEYHQTAYQSALNRIDELQKELLSFRGDIAGYRVALEAKDAQMADLQSRAETAMLIRDQAVEKAEKYKSACRAALGVLRAFEIENEPVITDGSSTDDQQPAETQS